jgi:glucokinase
MEYREEIYFKEFSSKDYEYFVLAADVGGTNTNTAICGVKEKKPVLIFSHHFQTAQLKNLHEAINETLKTAKERYDIEVQKSCIAGAGPVSEKRNSLNIFIKANWGIDAKEILKNTMLKSTFIINDFEAVGFGINLLDKNNEKDLIIIPHPNNYLPKGTEKGVIGVIGAGTGLGKTFLTYDTYLDAYIPNASEGGHADFPVENHFELEMATFVRNFRNIKENLNCEQLCSGPGIANIFRFLLASNKLGETETSRKIRNASDDDLPGLIGENYSKCEICREAMNIFTKNYAKLAKNFCLETMATGGLYIAGGIAAKYPNLFKEKMFMASFESVYEFSKILREIPVYVITNYNVSLLGAAFAAINLDKWAIKK